jgi:hypothetical protein
VIRVIRVIRIGVLLGLFRFESFGLLGLLRSSGLMNEVKVVVAGESELIEAVVAGESE